MSTRTCFNILLGIGLLIASIANAIVLGPPPYEVKNRHGVNIQSGQVSPVQTDISIGGSLGLSHTVATYTSNFVNYDDEPNRGLILFGGFADSYAAGIDWIGTTSPTPEDKVMRVVADGTAAEFYYNSNKTLFSPKSDSRFGWYVVDKPTDTTVYHQSIIDFNNSLNGGFTGKIFRKPDGTLVYFPDHGELTSTTNPVAGTNPYVWNGSTFQVTMPPSPNITGTYTISWTGTGHHSYALRNGQSTQGSGGSSGSITETNMQSGTYEYTVTMCPMQNNDNCVTSPVFTFKVDRPVVAYADNNKIYIQRPNGLVTTISSFSNHIYSVTTNTGFQLKYLYQNRTGDIARIDSTAPSTAYPPSDTQGWAYSASPKYILGINNAVDPCSLERNIPFSNAVSNEGKTKDQLVSDACPYVTTSWPYTTYDWPQGMPLAMFQSTASFKVTDAAGMETEYVHTPVQTGTPTSYPKYYKYAPRLTQIKKNGNVVMNYQFDTLVPYSPGTFVCAPNDPSCSGIAPNPGPAARLLTSSIGSDSIGYEIGSIANNGGFTNKATEPGIGQKGIAESDKMGMRSFTSWNQSASFDGYISNRLTGVSDLLHNKATTIAYDDSITIDAPANPAVTQTAKSQNIYTLTENGARVTKMEGYLKCDLLNYKVCNQPTKVTDPRNNTTYYDYDKVVGQVSKTSSPTDKNNVRAQTRYQYTPLYAYYKKGGVNTVVKASLPIYLLTRESSCQNTAATASGGCLGGSLDEIVTTYDYGPQDGRANNLLLRGVAVTAQNVTRRTCYQYDVYGNKIGETKPNAQLAACY